MWQSYFDQNKILWNEKAPVYLQSAFYDHFAFLKGKSSLTEIEADALGNVEGKSLLHLQLFESGFAGFLYTFFRIGVLVFFVE